MENIIIISQKSDESTLKVGEWLRFYGYAYQIINIEDIKPEIHISIGNNECSNNFFDEKVIWFRRGFYAFYDTLPNSISLPIDSLIPILKKVEIEALTKYTNTAILSSQHVLGCPDIYSPNKLQQLKAAQSVGLNIPSTIITTQKKHLIDFLDKHKELISKSIQYQFFHYDLDEKINYILYTGLVNNKNITDFPYHFFPTLFQEKINKKYEIRIFYLKGKCYASAIFSQNNMQTQIDYRKYDESTPNRNIPFILPPIIEQKIDAFMLKINLNCGSIDMIVDKTNKYYFLEVNPTGQFGAISYRNNFHLHKHIAIHLCNQ